MGVFSMDGYKIKDNCEKCGSNKDLNIVRKSFQGIGGEVYMEPETLCSPCRDDFEKQWNIKFGLKGMKHGKSNT